MANTRLTLVSVVLGFVLCFSGVLGAPVETREEYVTEYVAEPVPLTLLDVENTDESAVVPNPENSNLRTARGLGLLGGKFGGLGFGHGGFGLKGFGGLGGLGGHGFGGLHGLGGGFGGLGFKPFFGKKFF